MCVALKFYTQRMRTVIVSLWDFTHNLHIALNFHGHHDSFFYYANKDDALFPSSLNYNFAARYILSRTFVLEYM